MIHDDPHPLAGKTVQVHLLEDHPQIAGLDHEFRVEDWWDRVESRNRSWMDSDGNPAAYVYAFRVGFSQERLPLDNEVIYGKIGPFGHLIHQSEIFNPDLKELASSPGVEDKQHLRSDATPPPFAQPPVKVGPELFDISCWSCGKHFRGTEHQTFCEECR